MRFLPLPCSRVRRRLSAVVEGDLPPGTARQMERHLEACLLCQEEALGLAGTISLVRALPTVRAPWGFEDAVMRRVRAAAIAPTGVQRDRWRLHPLLPWALAGALGLVALLVLAAGGSQPDLRGGRAPAFTAFERPGLPLPERVSVEVWDRSSTSPSEFSPGRRGGTTLPEPAGVRLVETTF